MKARIIFGLLTMLSFFGRSQGDIPKFKHEDMIWVGYYNSVVLNKQWSINSDIQGRTRNVYKDWSQALIRTGLSFKPHERITLTAGVAHFRFFLTNTLTRGEWRPWQEIALSDKLGKVKLSHRLRFEQRFNQKVISNELINEYQFNHRFRYRLDVRFPVVKETEKNNVYVLIGNEIMINAGRAITNNYFDQNRTYAGINYELNKKISLQLQYMHIWQLLSNGITLDNIDVIRFNLYHTISL
jgi:hypothetical protein